MRLGYLGNGFKSDEENVIHHLKENGKNSKLTSVDELHFLVTKHCDAEQDEGSWRTEVQTERTPHNIDS